MLQCSLEMTSPSILLNVPGTSAEGLRLAVHDHIVGILI